MVIQDIKRQIVPILKRQGVTKAALFGSASRREMRRKSDIDVLVEFERRKSLLDLVRIQFTLEEKLGKKVDLLTYKSIHPLLRDIILGEQKIIYEKRKKS